MGVDQWGFSGGLINGGLVGVVQWGFSGGCSMGV